MVDELNAMSDEVLALHVDTALARPLTADGERPPALASIMTKHVMHRIFVHLGQLDSEGRGGLSKQAALARVINDFMRGSSVDANSWEYIGTVMYNAVSRPNKTFQAHGADQASRSIGQAEKYFRRRQAGAFKPHCCAAP